jgi:hypothetical protein
MLKRLLHLLAAVCLLAAMPTQFFNARAQTRTPLQEAIAQLTPAEQARLKAYETAHLSFQHRVDLYWHTTELKRKKRKAKLAAGKPLTKADYVNTQPPVYKGPERPADIMAKLPKPPAPPVSETPDRVAIVEDFLAQADEVYSFKPDRVSEDDFMLFYAIEAAKLGFTRDQVVRLYALETGGMGTSDLQSGYNPRTKRAASTALGYAQLLAANTIEQLRKDGDGFVARLERNASDDSVSYDRAESLRSKAAVLRRMIADAKKVRENWPAHVAYAKTPNGIAMHSLNLDRDVGPWLQVVKLKEIVDYAAKRGLSNMNGAQLEMMNLAGPSNGFDMMTPIGSKMPTSNFFERKGYERNPVAANKTGAELLAKLDEIMNRNVQKERAQRFAQIFDSLAQRQAQRTQASSDGFSPMNLFGR